MGPGPMAPLSSAAANSATVPISKNLKNPLKNHQKTFKIASKFVLKTVLGHPGAIFLPRQPQDRPKRLQDHLKKPQDSSKRFQDPPRSFKISPRGAQERPKTSPRAPKRGPRAPKRPPDLDSRIDSIF